MILFGIGSKERSYSNCKYEDSAEIPLRSLRLGGLKIES
jgi:hypothetical protein